MLREVEIQHSIPCINFQGLIPSFNSSLFVINAFVLTFPKIVFPPSPIIPYSSKDLRKSTFDLELPFRLQLSQRENQYTLHGILRKYTLHGIQNLKKKII